MTVPLPARKRAAASGRPAPSTHIHPAAAPSQRPFRDEAEEATWLDRNSLTASGAEVEVVEGGQQITRLRRPPDRESLALRSADVALHL